MWPNVPAAMKRGLIVSIFPVMSNVDEEGCEIMALKIWRILASASEAGEWRWPMRVRAGRACRKRVCAWRDGMLGIWRNGRRKEMLSRPARRAGGGGIGAGLGGNMRENGAWPAGVVALTARMAAGLKAPASMSHKA